MGGAKYIIYYFGTVVKYNLSALIKNKKIKKINLGIGVWPNYVWSKFQPKIFYLTKENSVCYDSIILMKEEEGFGVVEDSAVRS
jgi:hypothetical protein